MSAAVYCLQALMTDNQAAADTLKAALDSRSARLTEQDYQNLIEQTPLRLCWMLGTRPLRLALRVHLLWILCWHGKQRTSQAVSGSALLVMLHQCVCWHSPRLVRMHVTTTLHCLR